MAAQTSQFKIKFSFKQGEFVRVLHANIFEENVLTKHKNTTCERNGGCTE